MEIKEFDNFICACTYLHFFFLQHNSLKFFNEVKARLSRRCDKINYSGFAEGSDVDKKKVAMTQQ